MKGIQILNGALYVEHEGVTVRVLADGKDGKNGLFGYKWVCFRG